jgi:hypothetical protein
MISVRSETLARLLESLKKRYFFDESSCMTMDPGLESDVEEDMSESDSELEGSDDGEMQEARGIRPYLFEPFAEAEPEAADAAAPAGGAEAGEGAAAEPEGGEAGAAAARLGNNDW